MYPYSTYSSLKADVFASIIQSTSVLAKKRKSEIAAKIAVRTGLHYASVINYLSGKGTNIETALSIKKELDDLLMED